MNRTRLGGFFGRGIVQLSVTGWFVRSMWHPGRIHHVGTRQGGSAPVYGHGLGKTVYERHQPEQGLLYQLVEAHYPALIGQLAQQGKSLPDHVHREFECWFPLKTNGMVRPTLQNGVKCARMDTPFH